MKRHRTIASILALLAGGCAALPAGAPAAGPLLSGYGGPGAGDQAILGATLLNGPGSGGSTGGGIAGSGSRAAGMSSIGGASAADFHSAAGGATRTHAAHGGGAATRIAGSRTAGSATGASASGAGHSGASSAADAGTEGAPWFSGADLLALGLVVGALAITAAVTVRLTRIKDDRGGDPGAVGTDGA